MDAWSKAAILTLKADAHDVVFTGFISNAKVEHPAMLTGEVWAHVCADGFGTFADGHRIETSDIVQIHFRGDSIWVTTQSGSDCGILSFAPLAGRILLISIDRTYCLIPIPLATRLSTYHRCLRKCSASQSERPGPVESPFLPAEKQWGEALADRTRVQITWTRLPV